MPQEKKISSKRTQRCNNCCLQQLSAGSPLTASWGPTRCCQVLRALANQSCTELSPYLHNLCAHQNCYESSSYLHSGPNWELSSLFLVGCATQRYFPYLLQEINFPFFQSYSIMSYWLAADTKRQTPCIWLQKNKCRLLIF